MQGNLLFQTEQLLDLRVYSPIKQNRKGDWMSNTVQRKKKINTNKNIDENGLKYVSTNWYGIFQAVLSIASQYKIKLMLVK